MAQIPKPPRRSIVLAARLISVIIGLAGAEGILWFGGYPGWWQTLHISRDDSEYAPDPDLGWRNREGQFDLVVSDIDMPRLNGLELVRRIKADNRLQHLPVIIVSYKDRDEDRLLGLEAGANYYLTKSSFHDDTLIRAVRELIGNAEP